MTEENLSDKIEKIWIHVHKKFQRIYKDVVLIENIKKAVKKLKERFDGEGNIYNKENFHEEIDKIFGDKLIGKPLDLSD